MGLDLCLLPSFPSAIHILFVGPNPVGLSHSPYTQLYLYHLCPGTTAGELIVGVPLSVSSPVQTVKHMGFGGPEDLRVLVEGRLEEGKRESSIIPMCAERQEPQREPGTERPLFPGEIVWEVSTGLGTVWIGRPGPSLARALPP